MTKNRFLFLGVLAVLLFLPTVSASNHYTFEHAEEMRLSGRIDWQEYGPDAFNLAIEENKPIFLLLTAPSWCYWCHVYTSDDYIYHPDMYPIINEHFIPIYVDADKRLDLTRQYLEGGWPSTTVFTPDRQRLFGYSGPRPIANMQASLQQAREYVATHGFSNQNPYSYTPSSPRIPTERQLSSLSSGYTQIVLASHDPLNGGFGTGQKFPQGRSLDFALEQYEDTKEEQWLTLVRTTLQNQYTQVEEMENNYNLFDPVEGGFHRYGTQPNWTPPHYEKMLYDNAKLLRAYGRLQQLTPQDPIVEDVVTKTRAFIEENWYDPQNGGFYGNSDVHGEDAYYGKNPRPENKPRVEQTKYSNWNAEAVLTYLSLYARTGDSADQEKATKTLDFFAKEMVSKDGAYHFMKVDGKKEVRGALVDNAYLSLAFVEGAERLDNPRYLVTARALADYSLSTLYDWNSGGFFERNSPDTHLYAPGEHVLLSKPSEENGIMAYVLLKLYTQTQEPVYLHAGLRTLGAMLDTAGGLDRGYYYYQAAQYVQDHALLKEYTLHQAAMQRLEQEKQQEFWLNTLLNPAPSAPTGLATAAPDFQVTEEGLDSLEGPIFLLLLVAFLAGVLSFASPCTLPILPAYLAYSFQAGKRNMIGMTVAFFLGLSLVFTLLGMSATFIGALLKTQTTLFSQVAGLALLAFGLYILSGRGFGGMRVKQQKPTTFLGAFFFGAVLGVSWTPCVGPILVAILLLASTTSSVFTGGLLLFTYAVGLALPLLLVSVYLQRIDKNSRLWKLFEGKELSFTFLNRTWHIHSTSLISGVLFLILGALIFTGTLIAFNQYVSATAFQKIIFGLEEGLLALLS